MSSGHTHLGRRTYTGTVGLTAAGMIGLAGGTGDAATGTLPTHVTDQSGDVVDFESCAISIAGTWHGPDVAEGGEEDGDEPGGREYYENDELREADRVDLQDGNTKLVDERESGISTSAFRQLDTDGTEATHEDGSTATVDVPGDALPTFDRESEVRENTRTVFAADVTPVERGRTGRYVLQPVPDGIAVDYEAE